VATLTKKAAASVVSWIAQVTNDLGDGLVRGGHQLDRLLPELQRIPAGSPIPDPLPWATGSTPTSSNLSITDRLPNSLCSRTSE
jgi:hypothetical protein